MGAFDQAGNVRHYKTDLFSGIAHCYHSQVRLERGKGIIRYLGPRRRNPRYERGLADVWVSDESDIREKFKFEPVTVFLAGPSGLMLARSLMHGRSKARIAPASAASTGDCDALVGSGKVEDFFSRLVVVDNRPDRNFQDHIAAVAPGLVGAFAVTSALGLVFGIETEGHQRVVALAGFHDHVAALATISTRRPAPWDKLLTSEGHAAIAAIPCLAPNFAFVDEHESRWSCFVGNADQKQNPRPEGRAVWRGRPRPRLGWSKILLFHLRPLHHPELARRTFVLQLDAAGNLGEERVVFAAPNVQAGFHRRAALPHDDGASGNDLPPERFESKPLRVRVATVS